MICGNQPFWIFVNCYSLLVQRYVMGSIPVRWLYGYILTKIITETEHIEKNINDRLTHKKASKTFFWCLAKSVFQVNRWN